MEEAMKKIPLTQGYVSLVDDEDFERLSAFKWYAHKEDKIVYAWRYAGGGRAHRRIVKMHREIMNAPDGVEIDHENGDGLDNQKENLRSATHRQNLCNRRKQSGTSSQFKGVSWYAAGKKWSAYIKTNQSKLHLGYFSDETAAARAYDAAAEKHFGPFARLNFPL